MGVRLRLGMGVNRWNRCLDSGVDSGVVAGELRLAAMPRRYGLREEESAENGGEA